jgi:predicted RND superfamily exporter protein
MSGSTGPGRGTYAFVAWTLRHGWLLWMLALVFAVPATMRTVGLYRHLKSDLEELLPRESHSVRALDEMRDRLPGLQYLAVVVDTGTPENVPAAERFLDELAGRIRTYPPEMVREVRTGAQAEKKFVEQHAPLYVDVEDLREVLRRIEARRDYEVEKESGSLLDDSDPPPSLDVKDIQDKYDQRHRDKKNESGRFSDAKAHVSVLFVEAGEFSTGADRARVLLSRVKDDLRALGGPDAYARGMRVGYASDVAISVEEMDALEADLSVSSIVVIALEIAVIVLYYRWWRAVPVLFPPLLLATVYAFGLASLPPANVTALNSNTAFLGSIIVGNGINVGIVLLARYREARRRGLAVDDALAEGVWGARLGTLAAAFAAAVSYASLLLTEFRGFRQFGYIGGAGMVASWVTAFVLLPPLVKWFDGDEDVVLHSERTGPGGAVVLRSDRSRRGIMGHVVAVVERWPRAIVVVALAMTAVAAFAVTRFDKSTGIEYDLAQLRRIDTWDNGDGYWGRKVNELLGRYPTPTVVLLDSPEQARRAEEMLRASVDHGALSPLVASVRGADDVLPADQEAKLAVVSEIRDALTPKIRSLVAEEERKKLDDFLGPADMAPIRLGDLPRSFTAGLREKDGSIGKTVLVYPRPSNTLWQAQAIHDFVQELRATGGRVAGSLPLTDDIMASISRDAPVASFASFVGVIAIVLLVLRGRLVSLHVIGSLVVGVLWLAGAAMLLHIKINFVNFVAYPITFGIGVDYAVNVMTRYVQDGERDVTGAVRSTGAAVGLCSLTTTIGYSSLLLAKNRALYFFGFTAVLGEMACLTAAVVALPALLVAAQRFRTRLAKGGAVVRDSVHGSSIDSGAPAADSARLRSRDSSSSASAHAPSPRIDG